MAQPLYIWAEFNVLQTAPPRIAFKSIHDMEADKYPGSMFLPAKFGDPPSNVE